MCLEFQLFPVGILTIRNIKNKNIENIRISLLQWFILSGIQHNSIRCLFGNGEETGRNANHSGIGVRRTTSVFIVRENSRTLHRIRVSASYWNASISFLIYFLFNKNHFRIPNGITPLSAYLRLLQRHIFTRSSIDTFLPESIFEIWIGISKNMTSSTTVSYRLKGMTSPWRNLINDYPFVRIQRKC